jgi:hypothetical protein
MSKRPTSGGAIPNVQSPIEWHVPSELQGRYATLFAVQPGPYEINILFFEPQLPIFGGTPEQIIEQAQKVESVRAECVGKIVVAPERLPELIALLTNAMDNYKAVQVPDENE